MLSLMMEIKAVLTIHQQHCQGAILPVSFIWLIIKRRRFFNL